MLLSLLGVESFKSEWCGYPGSFNNLLENTQKEATFP